MSGTAKQIFLSTRLPGFTGRGDKYLGEIAQELRRVLWKTQNSFTFPACRLPEAACSEVAVLLVEWAEDIHNDIGLWRTVEAHQRRWFGTPLPLVAKAPPDVEPRGFEPGRVQFFLWNMWPCLNPEVVISPGHEDLKRLAAKFFLEVGIYERGGSGCFVSVSSNIEQVSHYDVFMALINHFQDRGS